MKEYYNKDEMIYFYRFEQENLPRISATNRRKFQDIVESFFRDYLSKKRQRAISIDAICFIVTHLCLLVKENIQNPELSKLNDTFCDIDEDKHRTPIFVFSKDNSIKKYYRYSSDSASRFSHSTLISCMEELERRKWVIHENGYYFKNKINPKFVFGKEYLNFPVFYNEFFVPNSVDLLNIFRQRSTKKITRGLVELREIIPLFNRDGSVKGTQINDIPLSSDTYKKLPIITNSKKFVKSLCNHYKNINVSLSAWETLTFEEKEIAENLWKQKYNNFDETKYVHHLNIARNIVEKSIDFPRRILHIDQKQNIGFGRIYGNKRIDNLPRFFKPLITINGDKTSEIDIKSCFVQLFVLTYCKNVDNAQDFYLIPALIEKYNLSRDSIKLLFQCLINNESLEDARRAYWSSDSYNGSLPIKMFSSMVDEIIIAHPYLKEIFFNKPQFRQIILIESNFMINVMKYLISESIPFIYHFDSLIVRAVDKNYVKDVFQNIANDAFGKSINLG